MLLFVAGITTTSGLISNSLLHLDRFPDQRDLIRDDPSVIPAAIEELSDLTPDPGPRADDVPGGRGA